MFNLTNKMLDCKLYCYITFGKTKRSLPKRMEHHFLGSLCVVSYTSARLYGFIEYHATI